jgi:hypothetical protein
MMTGRNHAPIDMKELHMARNEGRRQNTNGGGNEQGRANDSVRALLTRTERRLRRIGQNRGTPAMKKAYREAANKVHRLIPGR